MGVGWLTTKRSKQCVTSWAKHLVLVETTIQLCNLYLVVCLNQSSGLLGSGKSLFAILALGGRSFKYVLDLSRKSRQNWGIGGQSIVGPLSQDYSIVLMT